MKSLIAFFSRKDENYVNGTLKYLEIGNTEVAANVIQDLTNADIFQIEPKQDYSKDYNTCINEAQKDQKSNARPELKNWLDNIDEYNTIYLGYPNYWGTMPMHVFTFLEHYDFTNKIIKPFCTHEGSRLGNSLNDIKKLCPNANVVKGIAIKGNSANSNIQDIQNWIRD